MPLVKMQFVVGLRSIERIAMAVHEIPVINRILARVAIQPELGSHKTIEIVAFQKLSGSEQLRARKLIGVDLLLRIRDLSARVANAIGDCFLNFRRELCIVESLSSTDAQFCKASQQ